MNEDEAFIRAIVDSPGDDTPRLVYADWLDDRDDPRGPYLRAEHEWVKTGKGEKKLRLLAASLDAVWVARVSRPPVGICADKIVMRTNREPATVADLDAVEAKLKLQLPAEFRALLMNWNGASLAIGKPQQPESFQFWISELESFLHVVPAGKVRHGRDEDWWDVVDAAQGILDPQYLFRYGRTTNPMQDYIVLAQANEGDFYMIGVRGKVVGKVAFFHDFTHNAGDPDHLGIVTPSLGALFVSILQEAPEWYRLIKNSDNAGLLAWLDAGGDIDDSYSDNGESPLSVAITLDNLALVNELLNRGATVTRDIRDVAKYGSGKNGRKIRNAVAAKRPAPKKRKP